MGTGQPIVILADDLSGACETAAAVGRFPVFLATESELNLPQEATGTGYVVDLGTRELPHQAHSERLMRELRRPGSGALLFVKTDSLLRGPVVATLTAVASLGRPVLYSPALPEHGRRIQDGKLLVNGIPLHETDLWRRERHSAPESISDLLQDLPHHIVAGDLQASDLAPGVVTVCDLRGIEDAERVVRIALDGDAVLVGSSALARALRPHWQPSSGPPIISQGKRRVLIIVGSAAEAAWRQAIRVADDRGILIHEFRETDAEPHNLAGDVELLAFAREDSLDPSSGPRLLQRLAALVADVDSQQSMDLVLIGGETARSVLCALDIHRLDVAEEIQRGAVLSTAHDRLVVTRPGSFGNEESLLEILAAVEAARSNPQGDNHESPE